MREGTTKILGVAAVVAPALHVVTDVVELAQGGFSDLQLWLNYAAFLPVPAIMLGLYAAQQPNAPRIGLAGALLYGFAFVYFAHTTLYALVEDIPTYEDLWTRLGQIYTAHGVAMIVGGLAFGWAALRARYFPAWTAVLFCAGLAVNFALALMPAPEIMQTLGTAIRNAGLVGMGWVLLRRSETNARP